MALFDDILGMLRRVDSGARPALPSTRDAGEEVAALRREVDRLQHTVAALVALLDQQGVTGLGSLRASAARASYMDVLERDDDDDAEAPALAESPYRGRSPDAAGAGCTLCGKPLGPDDPELSLGPGGRVCVGCFQRGQRG